MTASAAAAELLDLPIDDLLDRRFRAGREARGLALDAPFVWDAGPGFDELEELLDALTYRRQRLRLVHGDDEERWPYHASYSLTSLVDEIRATRAELRAARDTADGEVS